MRKINFRQLYKSAVYFSDDVQKDILTPDQRYPISYTTGEMQELVDAVRNLDAENTKEEISDVAYAVGMTLAQRTGLNLPLPFASPAIDKFKKRRKVWRDIFNTQGQEFNNAYLSGGSNYRKPKKIINALQHTGVSLDTDAALKILKDLNIEPEEYS